MKYIFFGTPRFAEIVLEALLRADMPPAVVVCNPDRPAGRKKIVTAPPVKTRAERSGIPVLQPEHPASIHDALAASSANLFVVAAYARIIPQSILDIPRLGTLGVHPSLLPRYRGASPIQSVILSGEKETGTTIYQMDEKMDRGAIIAQSSKIAFDGTATDYVSLEGRLAEVSAELLIKAMRDVTKGTAAAQVQDETRATFTKKFKTEDGFIEEADIAAAVRGDTARAETIARKINAFNPEPGAWTIHNGTRVKLLKAKIERGALMPLVIQNEGEKPKPVQSGSDQFF